MLSKSGLYVLKKWTICSQKVEYILSKSGYLTLYNIDIILTFHMMSLLPKFSLFPNGAKLSLFSHQSFCHFFQNVTFLLTVVTFILTGVTFRQILSHFPKCHFFTMSLFPKFSLFVKCCHFFLEYPLPVQNYSLNVHVV